MTPSLTVVSIQNVPVRTFKTLPCIPDSTCARGAGIHGNVLDGHTGFFSVSHHTHHTHHNTTQNNKDSDQAGWIRPGLPPLRILSGPIQHFRDAIWQAWQHKVATDLCKRKGFRGGVLGLIFMALINHLSLPT